MTTRDEIRDRLRVLVLEKLQWDELPAGPIVEQFDSLELMTLVVAVEDAFVIELEPEDEEQIQTVDDLIDIIMDKTGAEW